MRRSAGNRRMISPGSAATAGALSLEIEGVGMSFASSSYPLLNIFWSMFIFFLWILWIWIIIDIFRSHDLNGFEKALWFLFILFIPLIGVLVYLIARGGKMHEHAVRDARQQEAQFRRYVQETTGSQNP